MPLGLDFAAIRTVADRTPAPAIHRGPDDITDTSPNLDVEEIFLGRQPILDRNERLVGYELLFRAGLRNASNVHDDVQATASVISHAFGQFGASAVLGHCRGFINFSAEMLFSDLIELLPRDQVVLELLETVEITEEVVARCRRLKADGYSIALDDFVYDEAYLPLLDIVDVVKIDLLQCEREQLPQLVSTLRRWPVELVAEKVDSREQAQYCRELGFDLFQGYYFARPSILSSRRTDPSAVGVMTLLDLVLRDAETREIEEAFKHNPALTYNLLRLVNSAATGVRRQIGSVSQALLLLGRRPLQRWLQLLLFTVEPGNPFPSPLMQLAAGRARLMELLAVRERDSTAFADAAFMTGILSFLDVLFGMTFEEITQQFGVADDISRALLRREGALGKLLLLVESVESADRERVETVLTDFREIGLNELTLAEIEAMAWVSRIVQDGM